MARPASRQFARAYNAAHQTYRYRLRRSGLKPGDHVSSTKRLDLSAIHGIVACWDPSLLADYAQTLDPHLSILADRSGNGYSLISAYGGDDRPLLSSGTQTSFRTDGGTLLRRFDALGDTGDDLFAGGGMILATAMALTSGGILIAKWNETGWILYGSGSGTMTLEAYSETMVGYRFSIPVGSRFLLEVEWDSTVPSTSPAIRINGNSVAIAKQNNTVNPVSDALATLCVGNRNWGTLKTPWIGTIGEILLLSQIPTSPQIAAIRSDMTSHWRI